MAYTQSSGKLSFESASKLGHLPFMSKPLIRYLVAGFQRPPYPLESDGSGLNWQSFTPGSSPIETVIACDGSYAETDLDACGLVYIRVGVQQMGVQTGSAPLHPFALQQEVLRNSDCVETVLPLELPCLSHRTFDRNTRWAIYETFRSKAGLTDTLRWIFSEGWAGSRSLPPVSCPHCGRSLDLSTQDIVTCTCGETVYVTDILRWSRDLRDDSRSVEVPTRFMLVLEFILLMTCIRKMWQEAPAQLNRTLFLHDGPLSIGGQYTQLINPLRRFVRYASRTGRPVYLCGVEKTGRFVNHLRALKPSWDSSGYRFSVPTHAYIQTQIDGRPLTAEHKYGERNLLGERVFLLLPEGRQFVLTVPSVLEQNLPDRPLCGDLIGLEPILWTIPALVTPVYDNALFPITRVNALVSMAQRPCGRMLELFSSNLINKHAN